MRSLNSKECFETVIRMEPYNYRELKTVAVLSSKIPTSIALNVLGHLGLSIGTEARREDFGQHPIIDGSGIPHHGISKYPFIITRVKPSSIRKAIAQARLEPALTLCDYPKEMLETGHDDELVAALGAKQESELEYLGMVVFGPSALVDEITGRFSLWRDEVTPPVPKE